MKKRITALLMVITIAVVTASVAAAAQNFKASYIGEMKTTLKGYANIISQTLPKEGDNQSLAEEYAKVGGDGLRVTLIGENGAVLADTAGTVENHIGRPEVVEAKKSGEGYSTRKSATTGNNLLYYAKTLNNGDILRLSLPLKNSADFVWRTLPMAAALTAVFLICAYIAADRLTKRLLSPLVELHGAVSDYIAYKKPFDYENAYPETEEIARAFARLCAEIEEYVFETDAGRRKLELTLENIQEGLIVTDGEGEVLIANAKALEICGLKAAPAHSHLLYYLRNGALLEEIENAYCAGKNSYVDYVGENNRQYRFHLIFVANNAFLKRGDGLFILITDRTEEALAEKVRLDFASNVSHELKTPLTSINGYAQLIANGMVKDADAVIKYAGTIVNEADRLIGLINDTLELSKLDEIDAGDLRGEEVNLYNIANAAADALGAKTRGKNAKISISGNAMVNADRERLFRLIYNLLENAVKYGRAGGNVEVFLSDKDGLAEITVKDDGIGIPEAETPRIFERFYRASNAGAGAVEGTGLGLAIVKHIAKIYGGDVSVTSALGAGSKFTVRIGK